MIRRICLYGGPGAGKTTLAYKLAGALKERHHEIHLIQEYIKLLAYQSSLPDSFGQLKIFQNQLGPEDEWLQHVGAIVTDSPILLPVIYSQEYGFEGWPELLQLARRFDEKYPSLNFYLHRKYDYVSSGRYQDEEAAKRIDQKTLGLMNLVLKPENTYYDDLSFDQIVAICEDRLRPEEEFLG